MLSVVAIVIVILGLGWLLGPGGSGTDGGERPVRVSEPVRAFEAEARSAAAAAGVPPDIVLSVVDQESDGNPDAVGPGGEVGLMQLKQIAVDDVAQNTSLPRVDVQTLDGRAPQKNLTYGAHFLALQRERVRQAGDMDGWFDALRSYNCGFSRAREAPSCGASYASDVLGRTARGVTE